MSWRIAGRALSRVLVTRLRYLGDVVMATSVVEALRRGDSALEIGFLCEEAHAPVLAGHPDLARIHALAVRRRGRDARAREGTAGGGARARGTWGTTVDLREARYDAAVDLFFNPRSAWLLALSGAPLRLAGPAGGRTRFYTHASAPGLGDWPAGWHALAPGGLGEHLARLAPLVHVESGLRFADWFVAAGVPARVRLAARARPAVLPPGLRAGPYLVLAPGATWATKRWPIENWRELVSRLAAAWEGPLLLLTAPGAEALGAAVGAALPTGAGAVLPVLDLPAVLDLLAGAAGLVTVDGGIMHAAVALGTPTLALFGPTDPALWFPYEAMGPFRVLASRPHCHPCDRHDCEAFICLPELSGVHVAASALALFRAPGGGG